MVSTTFVRQPVTFRGRASAFGRTVMQSPAGAWRSSGTPTGLTGTRVPAAGSLAGARIAATTVQTTDKITALAPVAARDVTLGLRTRRRSPV